MSAMYSKKYFESVKNATERASALANVATTTAEYAGAARGVRYDRVQAGAQKNDHKNINCLLNTIAKLDALSARALDARECALAMVAEASEIIEKALEQPNTDVSCIEIVYDYYVMCKTDTEIAAEQYVNRSRIVQKRMRGLSKLEPYVPHQ